MIKLIFTGLFVISLLLYLVIILFSFDYSDPGWMQSVWNESVCNIGGLIGARIADFLFFVFGGVAYLIPLLILFYFWEFFFITTHFAINVVVFRLFKILVFLIICCVLAQCMIDDSFYFPSGGIIGSILFNVININQYVEWNLGILFVGIICGIYFFNYFWKLINKIIIYIMYGIRTGLFMILKIINWRNHHIQQACFNSKICPSVFFTQTKPTRLQDYYGNVYAMNKVLYTYTKYIANSKNIFYPQTLNHSDTVKFIFKKYTMVNQHRYIVEHWKNCSKLNIQCKKYDFNSIKLLNKHDCQNNNDIKKLNKNIKITGNDSPIVSTVLKNNLRKNNNTMITHNMCSTHVGVYNLSNQIKSKVVPINKNLVVSSSKGFNTGFITHNLQKRVNSILPDINLLISNPKNNTVDYSEFETISQLIEQKLLEYRISANVIKIIPGPVITCFALNLSAGIKASKVSGISRDLARSLSVHSVRVVEVIPGTSYVGLEIPNKERHTVYLKDIIHSSKFQDIKSPLAMGLGKDIFGAPVIEDLRYMPHLLVAGTTGSGKSIGINAMIISILYKATPEDVRFIMIDPKILELSIYADIPHLFHEVITNTQDAESTLKWCVEEMERRYKLMSVLGVRNLESYNSEIEQYMMLKPHTSNKNKYSSLTHKKLPYIIVIIDELSDLMIMSDKKVEILITRLTQKARAAGIHLILSTQRPSVDVITGLIKANIPARIAFTVSSKIDSRTILGQSGAESLLGKGDMLYLPSNSSILVRIHGAYVQDQEIQKVVKYWRTQKN
ncbi:cell division protein FtsK [Candidatus Blochmanniella floridana]|uniref:Cell division protein FtsK n=1 Tax=Blochmanniella floridana TaxID=203907 RepID=Q7VR37_BLOFL|nr:cell division protein FtsK [Candidatus Blochmannia floridanus]